MFFYLILFYRKTSFSKEWLDHQIMNIITGKSFEYTGGILDKNGNCLCENCAISKCKAFMETKQLLDPNEKYLACNKCQLLTLIEQFSQHLLGMSIIFLFVCFN